MLFVSFSFSRSTHILATVFHRANPQLTTSLITLATWKGVLKVKQHCAMPVTCTLPHTRNCKTSYTL